jgi:hypothetical protein
LAFFGDIYKIMAAIHDTCRLLIHKKMGAIISRKQEEEEEEVQEQEYDGEVCEECRGAPLNLVSVLPDGRRIYSYSRVPLHSHNIIK